MRVKHLDELYTWAQVRKLQKVHAINPRHDFVPVTVYAPGDGTGFVMRLWEEARKELADVEAESLAFDVVEASECFNTIRFKNPEKAQSYRAEFWRQLKSLAESGTVKNDAESFCSWSDVEKCFIDLTEDELAFLHGEEIVNKPPRPIDRELMKACSKLDVAQVKALLAAGANPNAIDESPSPDTLITLALEGFWRAVEAEPESVETQMANVRQVVDLLVEHGCDLDLAPYLEATPLYSATYYARPDFIELLLEKGADPNGVSWISASNESPRTPLDSVEDDIMAYGYKPDLTEQFSLLEKCGGKFFYELVPSFFDKQAIKP